MDGMGEKEKTGGFTLFLSLSHYVLFLSFSLLFYYDLVRGSD